MWARLSSYKRTKRPKLCGREKQRRSQIPQGQTATISMRLEGAKCGDQWPTSCHSSVKNSPREAAEEMRSQDEACLCSQTLSIAQSHAISLPRVPRASASLRVNDGSQGSLRIHKTASTRAWLLRTPLLHQLCYVACGILCDQTCQHMTSGPSSGP